MVTVFSSTGCIRCRIVKAYLTEHGIAYKEYDVKTVEGSAAFKMFYREHRASVHRDAQGIFFPVVQDGDVIVQDAGVSLAWFMQGDRLLGYVQPNNLGHGWTGGLRVPPASLGQNESFLELVGTLKKGGLQTEVTTDGENAALLDTLLREKLIDRLIFEIWGRKDSLQPEPDHDREESLKAAVLHAGDADIRFVMDMAWFMNHEQTVPDPAVVGKAAESVRNSTGVSNIPCVIFDSSKSVSNLFPYRTAVRRWIARTELYTNDDNHA